MKTKELAPKEFGPLIVVTGDVYRTVSVPMTIVAYVDAESVQRGRDGKVMQANTLLSAIYKTKHLGDVTWETLSGDLVVLDAVNRYLHAIGVTGQVRWAPMDMQEPGRLEFRMKPHMVDMFFPELLGEAAAGGASMSTGPRRIVQPPELRLVV